MEAISTFDIFKVGVGPSSSHTMGPWRAAQRFLAGCRRRGVFDRIAGVRVDLYGSLAKTGVGHGTDLAVVLGLAGEDPVTCDPSTIHEQVAAIRAAGRIALGGDRRIPFRPEIDIVFHRTASLPFHPNGLTFTAILDDGVEASDTYYSIGGGFVVLEDEPLDARRAVRLPMPIETAADLVRHCRENDLTIPEVVRGNELTWRSAEEISAGLRHIWRTMRECIFCGSRTGGMLPGPLGVVRRAAKISTALLGGRQFDSLEAWEAAVRENGGGFRDTLNWVSCFALAVNEENAAFGRVVTAPTNGAAGVVPAVLMYYACFCGAPTQPSAAAGGRPKDGVEDFLLTAGEIGSLFKKGATLSAAQGGCQAEIGVSSAMAAAGLAQVLGGSPGQVLMAAEIAMEHHLGLTCDPVGGLVQVPCIERNTMGAVKAITAANLALESDPDRAKVSLDAVIRSMWATAQDMSTKYKETAEGGLAVQLPVSLPEC
ncbi:MAG TPA: L-serine ammonia-lyase [Gemmataceae bacterium]|nr:L-serine ammonia-lyase [Gemmataceae bacterium]